LYSGSLFNYLRSMGVQLSEYSEDAVPDALTIVVSAHENSFLPSAGEYILYYETEKIIAALKTVMENCRSEQGVFLVSGSSKELAENLKQRFRPEDKLKIMVVNDLYAAAGFNNGREKYLPQIPGCYGKDAAQGPCMVYSPREMFRIYEAVTEKKPVTDVFVYCTGEVNRPSVVNVPVGISCRDVIGACGGPLTEDYVITGKPSFNIVEKDTEAPVGKDTDTIVVLGSENPFVNKLEIPFPTELKRIKSTCSHCRFCTDMCPVYLEGRNLFPHLIVQALADGNAAESPWITGAELCTECGICTAVCPSGLSPVKINVFIKEIIKGAGNRGLKTGTHGKDSGRFRLSGYRRMPAARFAEKCGLSRYTIKNIHGEALRIHDIERVELLLYQEGIKLYPVVVQGVKVSRGTVIARGSNDSVSALHASISGRVTLVNEERIVIAA